MLRIGTAALVHQIGFRWARCVLSGVACQLRGALAVRSTDFFIGKRVSWFCSPRGEILGSRVESLSFRCFQAECTDGVTSGSKTTIYPYGVLASIGVSIEDYFLA